MIKRPVPSFNTSNEGIFDELWASPLVFSGAACGSVASYGPLREAKDLLAVKHPPPVLGKKLLSLDLTLQVLLAVHRAHQSEDNHPIFTCYTGA